MNPDVSILILTRDGIATLPGLLDALDAQVTGFSFETVAVDSGSRDGSLELLRRRVHTLVQVAPEDFNHGSTRNLGIDRCRGEFVVMIVQDAEPCDPGWLSALVAPLVSDPRLAATFARQVPRADASAVTRHYLSRWIAASPDPRRTFVESPEAFGRLSAMDRYLTCVFDNVCSCLRRSVWERIPFRRTTIAEDLEWGRDVLLAGHGIAYVPGAAVFHSHDRPASYELRRTYFVHQRLRELFGLATVADLRGFVRAVAVSLPVHMRCVVASGGRRRLRELPRALALAIAFPLGQYLGARSADTRHDWFEPGGV